MSLSKIVIPQERIENRIYLLREKKVMLDSDLAQLYGVTTKALVQAVKRNSFRFPMDFAYVLTWKEFMDLRSQIVTSKMVRGGRRYLPYVFTEQGIAMLSSVLTSRRAVMVNIQIMRAFTKLRELMMTHKDLQRKIEDMEKKYDHKFQIVFEAIKRLLEPPEKKREPIGFHPNRG